MNNREVDRADEDHDEIHETKNDKMNSMLLYQKSLQEAIRNRDRETVRKLMTENSFKNESKQANDDDFCESKLCDKDSRLFDAMITLGFSQIQTEECINDYPTIPIGLKNALEMDRHLPKPKVRRAVSDGHPHPTRNNITQQMLQFLDYESIWVLLQCASNFPEASQTEIYELLSKTLKLTSSNIVNPAAAVWIRDCIRTGYLNEMKHIIDHLCQISQSELSNQDISINNELNDEESNDNLLQSYICPITREILIDPVTLQCGHNFSRTALELSFVSGNRRCPICKASIVSNEFAINVILRDTIEKLYPHVLRQRAVEDVHLARRTGFKELKSVMRWLQNYPTAPEVVDACITTIRSWLEINVEHREKFIRDGHVSQVCKVFALLDVNSAVFNEMVRLLNVLCGEVFRNGPEIDIKAICGNLRLPKTAAASTMLTSNIHFDLLRILSYKVNSIVYESGLKLLMSLIAAMEDENIKAFLSFNTKQQEASSSEIMSPSPSRRGGVNAIRGTYDCLKAIVILLKENLKAYDYVWQIFDLCARCITAHDEPWKFVQNLLDAGFVECVLLYTQSAQQMLLDVDAISTLLKSISLLSTMSFSSTNRIRSFLLSQFGDSFLNILLEQFSRNSMNWDLSLSLCEGLAGMLYGKFRSIEGYDGDRKGDIGGLNISKDELKIADSIGGKNLAIISKILKFKMFLNSPSLRCRSPYITDLRDSHVNMVSSHVFGSGSISIFNSVSSHKVDQISSVEYLILNPHSKECTVVDKSKLPLLIECEMNKESVEYSILFELNDCNVKSDVSEPYLVVMRKGDLHKLDLIIPSDPSKSAVSFFDFPHFCIDLRTGLLSQKFIDEAGVSDTEFFIEEVLPSTLLFENRKRFRLDCGKHIVQVSINGIRYKTLTFPYLRQSLMLNDKQFKQFEGLQEIGDLELRFIEAILKKQGSSIDNIYNSDSEIVAVIVSHSASLPEPVKVNNINQLYLAVIEEQIPDFSNFEKIKIDWTTLDSRRLSLNSTGEQIKSKVSYVNQKNEFAFAATRPTLSGSFVYKFVIENISQKFKIGLISQDTVNMFSFNSSLSCSQYFNNVFPQLSILYSSDGEISVKVSSGFHPFLQNSYHNPFMKSGDTIHFEIVQLETWSLRIYHNARLIYLIDDFQDVQLPMVALSSCVLLSPPPAIINVELYSKDLNDYENYLWLYSCCNRLSETQMRNITFADIPKYHNLGLENSSLTNVAEANLLSLIRFSKEFFYHRSLISHAISEILEVLISKTCEFKESEIQESRLIPSSTMDAISKQISYIFTFDGKNKVFLFTVYKILYSLFAETLHFQTYVISENHPFTQSTVLKSIPKIPVLLSQLLVILLQSECPVLCRALLDIGILGIVEEYLESFSSDQKIITFAIQAITIFLKVFDHDDTIDIMNTRFNSCYAQLYHIASKLVKIAYTNGDDQTDIVDVLSLILHHIQQYEEKQEKQYKFNGLTMSSYMILNLIENGFLNIVKNRIRYDCMKEDSSSCLQKSTPLCSTKTMELILLLCTGGSVRSEPTFDSICFHFRSRGISHIWSKPMMIGNGVINNTRGEDVRLLHPTISVSSGHTTSAALFSSDSEKCWHSEGACPQWIDIEIPRHLDWSELELMQYSRNSLFSFSYCPEVVLIKIGDSTNDLKVMKDIRLKKSSEWQLLLSKEECGSHANEINVIRIEILQNFRNGFNSRIGKLRLTSKLSSYDCDSPLAVTRSMASNFVTWPELFYYAILDNNMNVIEKFLTIQGPSIVINDIFKGYGPWQWGHPNHNPDLDLMIPFSPIDLINILSSKYPDHLGYANLKCILYVSRDKLVKYDEESQSEDESANCECSVASDSNDKDGTLATTTMAAIRTLVREEQLRVLRLVESVAHNISIMEALLPNATNDMRTRALGPVSDNSSNLTNMSLTSFPSGPKQFLYKCANGMDVYFDATNVACAPFGLFHGQTVISKSFPEVGVGTVIGVYNNYIWIHLERNQGATYRKDNWQFADLAVLKDDDSCNTNFTAMSKWLLSSQGVDIKVGDRVRRGVSWQWNNQDVFSGNLGTVISVTSGSDLWVGVDWDGGDRNTYRWGAEGQYDLEIVRLRNIDVTASIFTVANIADCEDLQSLTYAEIIRYQVRLSDLPQHIIQLFRHSVTRDDANDLLRKAISGMIYIASYDFDAASSLQVTLRDVALLADRVVKVASTSPSTTTTSYTESLEICRFLSILSTTGVLKSLLQAGTGEVELPFSDFISSITRLVTGASLALISLPFLVEVIKFACANCNTDEEGYLIKNRTTNLARKSLTDRSMVRLPKKLLKDLNDKDTSRKIFRLAKHILLGYYSCNSIALALDLIIVYICFKSPLEVAIAENVDQVVMDLASKLNIVVKSEATSILLKLSIECTLQFDKKSLSRNTVLMDHILSFASASRDFSTIVEMMQIHQTEEDIFCKCVDLLLGGRKKAKSRLIRQTNWRQSIIVNDKVDARDKSFHWYEAVVKEVYSNEVLIHYMGWGSKYDEWIDIESERIQPLGFETGNWRDMIRIDDSIEILCLHHEASEMKRRWFRGIVSKIEGNQVLVSYDKRGVIEERWVDRYDGEEICKVGTHVPSAVDYSIDLLKLNRKKEMLSNHVCEVLLSAASANPNNTEIIRASFELLNYLLSGDDYVQYIEQIVQLGPAECIVKCLDIHSKDFDIVELGCKILEALTVIPESHSFNVGDLVYAQWRRQGNTSFPGRITRVREDGSSFDIHYDDGDHEERVTPERIVHRSATCNLSSAAFVKTLVQHDAARVLVTLLYIYDGIDDKSINIPVIFLLSALLHFEYSLTVCNLIVQSGCHLVIIKILDNCSQVSTLLVQQCLMLVLYISESSSHNKNAIFVADIHKSALACLSIFSHVPKVVLASLKVLTSLVSVDGAMARLTYLAASSGNYIDLQFCNIYCADSNIQSLTWASSDYLPTEDEPHWIEFEISRQMKWHQLQMLLRDDCSIDKLIIQIKDIQGNFIELKTISDLNSFAGWFRLISSEDFFAAPQVAELVYGNIEQMTVRLVISQNVDSTHPGHSICSRCSGLRFIIEEPVREIVHDGQRLQIADDARKDSIESIDGVSMIVESLLQFKATENREVLRQGRAFLRMFASNDARTAVVNNCGGGYIFS